MTAASLPAPGAVQPDPGAVDVRRVGVVLPVHDEEGLLPEALTALERAIRRTTDYSCAHVAVVIVLDTCADASRSIAEAWRRREERRGPADVVLLETTFRSVGRARRAGCRALLDRWSDVAADEIWLATTDADSEVPENWLTAQLGSRREGAEVWIGAVDVDDWFGRSPATEVAWRQQYETEALRVHGANFGIDGRTYLAAGGFDGRRSSEDRALFERSVALGAAIHTDLGVRVTTSGRRDARAPLGFAHALTVIEGATPDAAHGR